MVARRFALSVLACLTAAACSKSDPVPQIRISEVMYHPAAEAAYEDVAEFVELANIGDAPVDLSGWQLVADHVDMTLPEVELGPGGYLVISRDAATVAAVWGVDPSIVIGDFTGNLDNGKDDVTLLDAHGTIADSMAYSDTAPWPVGADGLGASEEWLPASLLPVAAHEHKGYSLERVSLARPATEVANWVPSPLDGATPGAANAGTADDPPAIVTDIERSGDALQVTTSANPGITAVEVEWFVDDLAVTGEPTMRAALARQPSGVWSATLPSFAPPSIVRYRLWIDSGAGPEVISPRPSDPYAWHAFAVVPHVDTTTKLYQLYIAPSAWGQLWTNLANDRDSGCTVNPAWDGDVPAVVVFDGEVYDVRARYQGSRYNRKRGPALATWPYPGPTAGPNPLLALSWHFKLPRYHRIEDRDAIILNKNTQGCPGYDAGVGFALWRKTNIPVPRTSFARLDINGGYYHYMIDIESPGDAMMKRYGPIGRLYKSTGKEVDDGGALGVGDERPLPAICGLSTAERFELTYDEHTNSWAPHDDLIELVDALDAARTAGIPAMRQFFADRFDVDALLEYMAIMQWAVPFDDMFQNHFLYHRRDGKWLLMPWDLDQNFGGWKDASASLYIGEAGDPDNRSGWWNLLKDAFIKSYRTELDARMRTHVSDLLSPASVAALVDDVTAEANFTEAASAPAGLACDPAARAASIKSFAVQRKAVVEMRTPP